MRYKKYIEPLWELQKEEILLEEKVKELQEQISHIKQEIFLENPEKKLILQDNWAIVLDPWKNLLHVYTKDEYEKHEREISGH